MFLSQKQIQLIIWFKKKYIIISESDFEKMFFWKTCSTKKNEAKSDTLDFQFRNRRDEKKFYFKISPDGKFLLQNLSRRKKFHSETDKTLDFDLKSDFQLLFQVVTKQISNLK